MALFQSRIEVKASMTHPDTHGFDKSLHNVISQLQKHGHQPITGQVILEDSIGRVSTNGESLKLMVGQRNFSNRVGCLEMSRIFPG